MIMRLLPILDTFNDQQLLVMEETSKAGEGNWLSRRG